MVINWRGKVPAKNQGSGPYFALSDQSSVLSVLIVLYYLRNSYFLSFTLKSFLNVYLLRSGRYTRPSLHEPIRTRLRGVNDASSHLPFPSWCREVAPRIDTPLQD